MVDRAIIFTARKIRRFTQHYKLSVKDENHAKTKTSADICRRGFTVLYCKIKIVSKTDSFISDIMYYKNVSP